MILCPNCLHKEFVGAIFCSECGTQIAFTAGVQTSEIHGPVKSIKDVEDKKASPSPKTPQPTFPGEGKIALNIISCREIVTLSESGEITMGRTSEGQPIIPDLDLTPYKAYEAGVSRMHASISINNDDINIFDLGAVNGTWLNGDKLTPHIAYPLHHGDIITLGKFKIQVLLGKKL